MKIFKVVIILMFLFSTAYEVYGQVTYTSNGSGGWIRTVSPGCENAADTPNLLNLSGTEDCPVELVINHAVNITSLNLGDNITINVNVGGKLNINGNLTQNGQTAGNIVVDGGEIHVGGNFILNSGANNGDSTQVYLDIRSNGIFKVVGKLDLKNNSVLEITGDGTSILETGLLDLGQRAKINIRVGGGLRNIGETNYAGNNSEINVWGFFRTGSLKVSGGSGKQLNTYDDAEVVIDGDLRVDGSGQIVLGGNSDVNIKGDVILNGSNDRLIIKDNAKVTVCGENTQTDPPPSTVDKIFLNECEDPNDCPTGGYYVSCSILPVKFLNFYPELIEDQRSINIFWSTSKEWENSHFEIERSYGGIDNFVSVGEISGRGWTDEVTEYTFHDDDLPLAGGNLFYRLKQIDFNGKYEYSEIVAVRLPTVQFTKGVWRAYPNPVIGSTLNIDLMDMTKYNNEKVTLRVMSSTSSYGDMEFQDLYELNEAVSHLFTTIPNGLYILEIKWGISVERIKVMKQ